LLFSSWSLFQIFFQLARLGRLRIQSLLQLVGPLRFGIAILGRLRIFPVSFCAGSQPRKLVCSFAIWPAGSDAIRVTSTRSACRAYANVPDAGWAAP